ncbi:MAG: diguanylate cyclase domain-containing protein [Planktomarina sp.]
MTHTVSAYTHKFETLDVMCPFHLRFDKDGLITRVGPSLSKLRDFRMQGKHILDVFEITRPADITDRRKMAMFEGCRVYLRFAKPPRTAFKGDISVTQNGTILNISFSNSVMEAIKVHDLEPSDFANTDMAIELLYLMEAKSIMESQVRSLMSRLDDARLRAEEQAATDQLTGLKNRRALALTMEDWLARKRHFACMHLDLDYFKSVNDNFGHAAGDAVLKEVSRVLKSQTRPSDTVARIGGDEFVVLMEGITDMETLDKIAKRIIAKLEVPVAYKEHLCQISGSAGTTVTTDYDNPTSDLLLHNADMALYASKDAGRGQHTLFDVAAAPPLIAPP